MKEFKMQIANREFKVVLDKFAKQADSSVFVTYGDTAILTTAVMDKKETDKDFFPLIVNYEEKLYADGKIPGSFSKREGKPSEAATLSARLIDRPVRPLFDERFKREIQIVNTVMSLDKDCEPEVTAINATSLALTLAKDIPFEGPIGAVHIGLIDNQFIVNPTVAQRAVSTLELRVAGTMDAVNMVEAKANELSEDIILDAIMYAHEEIKKIIDFQLKIVKELGIEKTVYEYPEDIEVSELIAKIENNYKSEYFEVLHTKEKHVLKEKQNALNEKMKIEMISEEDESLESKLEIAQDIVFKKYFREMIVSDKVRVDGRKLDEIRSLSSEVEVLARTHGSSLFTRGETQSLATVTLAAKSEAQKLDYFELADEKSFILHYNFPPYSVGETGRMGAPGRREIGHGNLAEKALSVVLPSEDEFGYAIRVVSEILESNGSSSQASICAGSMALMQAGVPLKKAVAGIAMGLIGDTDKYTILTDIQGLEDHLGDMDFKVAGTTDGICAIQMDIKVKGISKGILAESLTQARVGRLEILEHMSNTISKPNESLSKYAPKIVTLNIKPEQIKTVIGKGGDTINKIIEETGVKIDIIDDGTVYIYNDDIDAINRAKQIIQKLTKEYKLGEEYKGKVYRIEKFGAFVRFDDDKEVLIHISDLSDKRIDKVEDVLQMDQDVDFIISEIDSKGRMKAKLKIVE